VDNQRCDFKPGFVDGSGLAVLFSSFFSNVRVKIKCKNLARVPKERVYELGVPATSSLS
jgi:hypothetical protein